MKELEPVYGADAPSVRAVHTEDEYGGAHVYEFKPCAGWHDGKTRYAPAYMVKLTFVQKHVTPEGQEYIEAGLQSEQLVQCLIDRHEKLNKRFQSPQHEKMIQGLQMFLDACRERIDDRVNRGVMGDLKD